MISLRHMTIGELERIGKIDRSEHVTRAYTYRDGVLDARDVDIEAKHSVLGSAPAWRQILERGGVLIGAFEGDVLAGFAIYRPRLTEDMANLAVLHVSRSHRRKGLASRLVDEVVRLARADGARRLYVSATPGESAVGFYQSFGFEPTDEPNAELFALEPEDIHMIRPLAEARNVEVVPFRPELASQVLELIVGIQRGEFSIDISAEQQPDLQEIPAFYQVRGGNFWVALSDGRVVGTISLFDIGERQGALRKMFVRREFRGAAHATATLLLETLLAWARARGFREIFLGTTAKFLAAHRFYEKNGFSEIDKSSLPPAFPIMAVDTKFFSRRLDG